MPEEMERLKIQERQGETDDGGRFWRRQEGHSNFSESTCQILHHKRGLLERWAHTRPLGTVFNSGSVYFPTSTG